MSKNTNSINNFYTEEEVLSLARDMDDYKYITNISWFSRCIKDFIERYNDPTKGLEIFYRVHYKDTFEVNLLEIPYENLPLYFPHREMDILDHIQLCIVKWRLKIGK